MHRSGMQNELFYFLQSCATYDDDYMVGFVYEFLRGLPRNPQAAHAY